jgi:hypothetical protein
LKDSCFGRILADESLARVVGKLIDTDPISFLSVPPRMPQHSSAVKLFIWQQKTAEDTEDFAEFLLTEYEMRVN